MKIRQWVFPGLIALFIIFILNTFFFTIVSVPSADMRATLFEKDIIFINKFNCDYKRNDILAFKYYADDSLQKTPQHVFIQRCIGLPGDSIKMDSGNVFINKMPEATSQNLQFNFHLKSKGTLDTNILTRYKITEGGIVSDENDYSFSLTQNMADSLKQNDFILEIKKNIETNEIWDKEIFPHSNKFKWNKHNMSGFVIPKKNEVLTLDTGNIWLYYKLISEYENNKLEVRADSILINDAKVSSYKVIKNYYFVMGDNRDNAFDSRYWGFLPENYVIGKMSFVILNGRKR